MKNTLLTVISTSLLVAACDEPQQNRVVGELA